MTLVKLNWSLNIISEVLSMSQSPQSVASSNVVIVFVLPLPIIRNLKIPRKRERAGLLVLFLLGAITIAVSAARFTAMLFVNNNIAICNTAPFINTTGTLLTIADILATTEFTVSIMIPSLISLRPLLRKVHKWSSSGYPEPRVSGGNHTGVTSGKRKTGNSNTQKLKGSHAVYSGKHVENIYGSEVELTEQGPIKIYKTEEISVTSTREAQPGEDDNISR